jgi:hypothetical protein
VGCQNWWSGGWGCLSSSTLVLGGAERFVSLPSNRALTAEAMEKPGSSAICRLALRLLIGICFDRLLHSVSQLRAGRSCSRPPNALSCSTSTSVSSCAASPLCLLTMVWLCTHAVPRGVGHQGAAADHAEGPAHLHASGRQRAGLPRGTAGAQKSVLCNMSIL